MLGYLYKAGADMLKVVSQVGEVELYRVDDFIG